MSTEVAPAPATPRPRATATTAPPRRFDWFDAAMLALLVWKPIAVAAAFFGVRAYIRRTLPAQFDRRVALVLALFFATWAAVGDEWMPFWTWGYPFGLLAIAAMAVALVSYDRSRVE